MIPEFLWGAATSSHQVEGNNVHSDWWAWEKAGRVREASGRACNQFELFREDFQRAASLGHNAHRLSIEWSRLEPRENEWDPAAFQHYRDVLQDLIARGLEPVVTLHHFTHPQWFMDKGGWLVEQNREYFLRYVKKCVEALGPFVRFWITINEPLIYVYYSYLAGEWPPGKTSFGDSMAVFRQLVYAHVEAYQWIHQHYRSELSRPVAVSVAKHLMSFQPCKKNSWKDRLSVWFRNLFFNRLYFEALWTGFLFFPGLFCEFLPASRTLDFLGVNYYSRDFIHFKGWLGDGFLGDMCDKEHHRHEIKELNMMGWDIYPQGLTELLVPLKKYGLQVMICENGICTLDDTQRVRYIESHLDALELAMRRGVNVGGYFYWSLLDNFEWAHGFEPRFGLIEVNYQNQERKIRPSAQVLSRRCRNISRKI